jgi:hypothetical protein
MAGTEVLKASHVLEYPYSRSVGPVIGAFLTGVRDGKIYGARGSGGKVIVPPTEYDPETSEDIGELVEVGPGGVIETWAWVTQPLRHHPLSTPFAFALIRLDGADTALLHVVDVDDPAVLSRGTRVVPRWKPADERLGQINDIVAFVPEGSVA